MMEEPLSQGVSPSSDTNFCGGGELNSATVVSLDERILDISTRHSLNVLRTPPTKKAKRVRFFRNGDKFFTGVVMAVTPERYRSFDSLASDLTRALVSNVTLPNGVRTIYTMDGRKVQSVGDLEDGKCYVVSGQGEMFKKVEYSSSKVRRGSSLSGLPQSPAGTGRQTSAIPLCVKARIVTLIRHGTKPRKVVRLLLNKRNAPSLEHAMEAITEAVKLDSGAVRKVYTLSGQQVTSLEQFFENDEIFLAYGPEKSCQEDFELDFEESKSVQSFRKCPWTYKRQSGPMPKMPRKSGKKVLAAPQVTSPSPLSLMLPQPLRLHYAVGHVIGEGNFAVVRHCVHKSSGAEYAMKIVDKYKCQGRVTMLASEVAILRQVCHPNIISLIAEQETTDELFLVMELVKGGDLFDAIAAATKFPEAEASIMIGHLTSALAYLHSHHIVHRDVKPENLLVEMDGSHVRCLKLGDFGLAQVVREPLYTLCGTPTYVAPEMLAETGYGLKIDVWAAGTILYISLCGFPPFVSPENDQEELFERILSGQYEFTSPYWDTISDSAKELISNMLQAEPELRFSAEDVLDHPWLASFLGGEQTTASTPINSAEQHWDQQRKPLRLATFEFDYKKQLRGGSSQDHIDYTRDTRPSVRSRWDNVFSPVQLPDIDILRNSDGNQGKSIEERDEVDFSNGNRSDDEPVSLSADCLQDIHNLSQSMHNLINNLNENQVRQHRLKSTQSASSSLNSIPENVNLSLKTDSSNLKTCSYHSSSSVHIHVTHTESPVRGIVSSVNRRNGNSMTEINSIASNTLGDPISSNLYHFETPKNTKSIASRQRCKRRHLYENSVTSEKFGGKIETDDRKNCNTVSSSTDSLTGSSSNDSSAYLQFAQVQGQRSSSTQSMESTDSFENICFSYNQDARNDNVSDPNENGCAMDLLQQLSYSKDIVSMSHEKSATKVLPTRIALRTNSSKPSKLNNYLSNDNKRTSIHNTIKTQDTTKYPKSEVVKLRHGRYTTKNETDTKNTARSKRFSCFSPCTVKKISESTESGDKLITATSKVGRKFSSTDELRDEKQKQTVKSKRFSLYYTPQPLRKNYEGDAKVEKSTCKNLPATNKNDRHNEKAADASRRKDDVLEVDEKKNIRNRRSVVEGTTAASRSKLNKQSVHIRSNVVNSSLTPGRTK